MLLYITVAQVLCYSYFTMSRGLYALFMLLYITIAQVALFMLLYITVAQVMCYSNVQ
jgi:hypothetical protein